jgi:ADP-ribose pyrophosphatase YjhB (NUDIX family)
MKIIEKYLKYLHERTYKYTQEDIEDHAGIAAVIKDKEGKILVQKHVKLGFWTIPVGKVAHGQSIIDGLKQELKEECNIDVIEYKELMVRKYKYDRGVRVVTVTSHLFEVTKYKGTVKNNEPHKHSQQVFMSIQDIKKKTYISDATKLYFEYLSK